MEKDETELKELMQFGEIIDCKEQVYLQPNGKYTRMINIASTCNLITCFATFTTILMVDLTIFAMWALMITAVCITFSMLAVYLVAKSRQKKNKGTYTEVKTGKIEYTVRLNGGASAKELNKKFKVLYSKDRDYTVVKRGVQNGR